MFLGIPQRRSISFRTPDGTQNFIVGPDCIKFDKLELKECGEVKDQLYSETGTAKAKEEPMKPASSRARSPSKVCS